MGPCKYRCRGDFILYRIVNKGIVNGVVMPDIAQQGKERVVIAVGPKVEGLIMPAAIKFRRGQKLQRLTVEEVVFVRGERKWRCRCQCGNIVITSAKKLKSGHTGSCGCLQKDRTSEASVTHGKSKTAEYTIWQGMIKRCNSASGKLNPIYAGRGIKVCSRWRKSFENFLADMGTRPGEGYSIERRDNDGPYAPWNCCWATKKEQNLNKSTTVWLTVDGERKRLFDWSSLSGVPSSVISDRLRRKWPVKEAVFVPVGSSRRVLCWKG